MARLQLLRAPRCLRWLLLQHPVLYLLKLGVCWEWCGKQGVPYTPGWGAKGCAQGSGGLTWSECQLE